MGETAFDKMNRNAFDGASPAANGGAEIGKVGAGLGVMLGVKLEASPGLPEALSSKGYIPGDAPVLKLSSAQEGKFVKWVKQGHPGTLNAGNGEGGASGSSGGASGSGSDSSSSSPAVVFSGDVGSADLVSPFANAGNSFAAALKAPKPSGGFGID